MLKFEFPKHNYNFNKHVSAIVRWTASLLSMAEGIVDVV